MVEILYGVGVALTPLATVLVAWIRSRKSRKVIITTNSHMIVHSIEGMSVEDVEKILEATKRLDVIDTVASDKN